MNQIDPSLQIGSVELAVSDLQRSVDFYTQAMGMQTIERDERHAVLGPSAGSPALTLTGIDSPTIPPQRSTGLYHVAWLHPSARGARPDRQAAGRRAVAHRRRIGPRRLGGPVSLGPRPSRHRDIRRPPARAVAAAGKRFRRHDVHGAAGP